MTSRPAALWRCMGLSRFATAAEGIHKYRGAMWPVATLKALAHPILHIPPLVKQITLFHPITQSVSSTWFLMSSAYMLYFLVFLFFVIISPIENVVVRVLLYYVDHQPLQFHLFIHYLYMSWAVVYLPKQYMFFEDCGQWVSSCWKSTILFLFLMHLYSSISDAEPGKAYRWKGTPVPCVCWYMYLQTSSQANIVWRPHTLPISVWCEFHWHHLLRNRCMKPSVVAMQNALPLYCELYQMHHICTYSLATGDTVLVLIVDDNFFLQYPQYSDPIISI